MSVYSQEYPCTHFQRLSRPWAHGIVGCFPIDTMTRPGIDPGNFRLEAQRINHYATPDPIYIYIYNSVVNTVIIYIFFCYDVQELSNIMNTEMMNCVCDGENSVSISRYYYLYISIILFLLFRKITNKSTITINL